MTGSRGRPGPTSGSAVGDALPERLDCKKQEKAAQRVQQGHVFRQTAAKGRVLAGRTRWGGPGPYPAPSVSPGCFHREPLGSPARLHRELCRQGPATELQDSLLSGRGSGGVGLGPRRSQRGGTGWAEGRWLQGSGGPRGLTSATEPLLPPPPLTPGTRSASPPPPLSELSAPTHGTARSSPFMCPHCFLCLELLLPVHRKTPMCTSRPSANMVLL